MNVVRIGRSNAKHKSPIRKSCQVEASHRQAQKIETSIFVHEACVARFLIKWANKRKCCRCEHTYTIRRHYTSLITSLTLITTANDSYCLHHVANNNDNRTFRCVYSFSFSSFFFLCNVVFFSNGAWRNSCHIRSGNLVQISKCIYGLISSFK